MSSQHVSTQERPFALPLSENEIQRAVFTHLRTRGAPGLVAWHPKNGGIHQRGRRSGINSGLGVLSGASDVMALHKGQFYSLELKRIDKRVEPGDEQDRFIQNIIAAGGIAGWVAGLDAALEWLTRHGLLRGVTA